MSVTFRPPVQHSPLKRRFFHLGMERDDRPPRDYEDTAVPTNEKLSYVPRSFGASAGDDVQRLSLFDASGEAPPKPMYLTDIDRARHFVQLQGGMDVAGHFVNRPSYLLCRGGCLPMQHSQTYKQVLGAGVAELTAIEAQLAAIHGKKPTPHADVRTPVKSPAKAEPVTSSSTPSFSEPASPAATAQSGMKKFAMLAASPTPVPRASPTTDLQSPEKGASPAAGAKGIASPSPKGKAKLQHLTSFEVGCLRQAGSPSPSPAAGGGRASPNPSSAQGASAGPGSPYATPLTSMEVALSSSKQHASSVVRHFRRLQEHRKELTELSKAHHPNQLITYVEND